MGTGTTIPIMRHIAVARSIERKILDGTYGAGCKLPTEAELARSFKVSRNAVREAVARLRSDGMVWSRQGRGVFVTDLPKDLIFRLDAGRLAKPAELAKLFELRLEVEAGAAGLAAVRHSRAQLRAIARALDALHGAVMNREHRVAADAAFHGAVARAAGNHFIFDFVQVLNFCISRNAAHVRARSASNRDWSISVFHEHEAVHERIAVRDAEGARRAAREHLLAAIKRSGIGRHLRHQSASVIDPPRISSSTRRPTLGKG